jgi:hypothetical protein
MKSQIHKRLALVAMLFSLVFVVTNVTAKKPVKPPPDLDKTKAECIVFWGDLETVQGSEIVEGCCPNAGPSPAYTMTLDLRDEEGETYVGPEGETYEDEYNGQLFINGGGNGPNPGYKVQFWSWDWDTQTPGDGDFFFQIYGGNVVEDKKNKTIEVSFEGEPATLWLYDDDWDPEKMCCAIVAPIGDVSFDLLRTSDLSFCE